MFLVPVLVYAGLAEQTAVVVARVVEIVSVAGPLLID